VEEKICVGKSGSKNLYLDLNNLIATRLLIQANSGGGKSWLLRRLLEESHNKVQHIIIDLEGEFGSLREKFDYLLVGKEGEIPASIKTAELLAKRLLKLNVSTIVDLSELKHYERKLFVKRFLDSLINAPKKLWHPLLVVVDEAHQFAPQKEKSESVSAVIDLMTRGRKRGFCGILATQRLSKLNKDAVAECNNKLIGRTGLDVDMKRASDELGFTSKEQMRGLRNLGPGEFFAFGPSISNEIVKVTVGGVVTSHPKSGATNLLEVSPTPKNIQKLLKDVVDLDKESEAELRSKQDFERKITELKREVRSLKLSKSKEEVSEVKLSQIREKALVSAKRSVSNELNSEILELKRKISLFGSEVRRYDKLLEGIDLDAYKIKNRIESFKVSQKGREDSKGVKYSEFNDDYKKTYSKELYNKSKSNISQLENEYLPKRVHKDGKGAESPQPVPPIDAKPLRKGAMKMLNWLASAYPEGLTKQRLATLSGFSVKGGTFNTYISDLKRNMWVTGGKELFITKDGLANAMDSPPPLPTGEELLDLWCSKFRAGAAKILRILYDSYPDMVTKEALGYMSGFTPSGGTFNTYLSELRRNGLINVSHEGVTIGGDFFK